MAEVNGILGLVLYFFPSFAYFRQRMPIPSRSPKSKVSRKWNILGEFCVPSVTFDFPSGQLHYLSMCDVAYFIFNAHMA